MKKYGLSLIGVALILTTLSACSSDKNPLQTAPEKEAATFLVNASQYAEKQLHSYQAPGGEMYGECMSHQAKKISCEKLYQYMSEYAKNTAHFNTVTVSNLKDQSTWQRLKASYQREQFNAI